MVKVFEKKSDKLITFGELVKQTSKIFVIHSSSKVFKKSTYYFKKDI